MSLQGFDRTYYLNAKLTLLRQQQSDWQSKTITDLETVFTSYGLTSESHYSAFGYKEGLVPNAYFNAAEYKQAKAISLFQNNYAITVSAGLQAFAAAWPQDPYLHYLTYGFKEGLNPSNSFDQNQYYQDKLELLQTSSTEWKSKTVSDLKTLFSSLGMSPLAHYIDIGAGEGLHAAQVPDSEQVDTNGGGSTTSGYNLTIGADNFTPTSSVIANKTTTSGDSIFGLTSNTFDSEDVLDGGDGTDSLIAVMKDVTVIAHISHIESITVRPDTNGGDVHIMMGLSSDYTSLIFDQGKGTDTAKFSSINSVLTSLSIANNNTNQTNYTFIYGDGVLAGTADSVSLSVHDNGTSMGIVTITEAATAVTVDSGAEILSIVSTGTGNTIGTLSVSVNSASSMNTLNITGTGPLSITNSLDFEGTLAGTINASGFTGNFSAIANKGEAITFTGGTGNDALVTGTSDDSLSGGAGDDSITISAGGDTVDGGKGNDRLIIAIGDLTASDSIDLGEGSLDAVIYTNVVSLGSAGIDAAALDLLNSITNFEVVGGNGPVTSIDAGYFIQTIFRLEAALTAPVNVFNAEDDALTLTQGINLGKGHTDGDCLTVHGATADQTFSLSLHGDAAVSITASNAVADNAALCLAQNISTVELESSTSGTGAVTNFIGHEGTGAAKYAVDNTSASSFTLSGDQDLIISSGAVAGFSKTVSFDASGFSGDLSIVGSEYGDLIKGGKGNDVINGDDGDDTLTGGSGSDTFTFASGDASTTPNAVSVFETVTDYQKGSDIIDWDNPLNPAASLTAPAEGKAQVNAQGVATFHSSDDTLAERLAAVLHTTKGDGDFVVFSDSTSSYIFISGNANQSVDASDALIKLTGVKDITTTVITDENLILS